MPEPLHHGLGSGLVPDPRHLARQDDGAVAHGDLHISVLQARSRRQRLDDILRELTAFDSLHEVDNQQIRYVSDPPRGSRYVLGNDMLPMAANMARESCFTRRNRNGNSGFRNVGVRIQRGTDIAGDLFIQDPRYRLDDQSVHHVAAAFERSRNLKGSQLATMGLNGARQGHDAALDSHADGLSGESFVFRKGGPNSLGQGGIGLDRFVLICHSGHSSFAL